MSVSVLKLADQLHRGNAAPPPWMRFAFYQAKDVVLRRHAVLVDHDIQEIVHPCWACHGGTSSPPWLTWPSGRPGTPGCPKCGGTGIYMRRRYYLERYRFGPYVFHKPLPDGFREFEKKNEPASIVGKIQHEPYPDSAECALRVAFLYSRSALECSARCNYMFPPTLPDSSTGRAVQSWLDDEHAKHVARRLELEAQPNDGIPF